MICPMPNTHDPNPTAVPIKEAIKETFRVLMAILDCWIRQKNPVSFHPAFVDLADSWRNISITLKAPSMSETAWFRQLPPLEPFLGVEC